MINSLKVHMGEELMAPQCPPPMPPLAVWTMPRRRHGLDFGSLCPAPCHHEPPCVLGYHGGVGLLFHSYSALCCEWLNLKRASAQPLEMTQRICRGQGLAHRWSAPSPSIHSWSPLSCSLSCSWVIIQRPDATDTIAHTTRISQ